MDQPRRGGSRQGLRGRPGRGRTRGVSARPLSNRSRPSSAARGSSNPRGKSGPRPGERGDSRAVTSPEKPAQEIKSADESEAEPASLRDEQPEAEVPIFERTSLSLASHPLPPRSALAATLAKFTSLHRLDVSYMQPTQDASEAEDEGDGGEAGSHSMGLQTLRFLDEAQRLAAKEARKTHKADPSAPRRRTLAETLTWINLAGNTALGDSSSGARPRTSDGIYRGLEHLKNLFVLNISSCSLTQLPPRSTFLALSENLRALVLSHNRLSDSSLQVLPFLPNLNTLVLSHNRLTKLPKALPGNVPKLAKLSLSHNDLTSDDAGLDNSDDDNSSDDSSASDAGTQRSKGSTALPDFTMNTALREVRLSHNVRLSRLPLHVKHWGRGLGHSQRGLDLLDVGHCNLSWDNVVEALFSKGDANDESQVLEAADGDDGGEMTRQKRRRRRSGLSNFTLAGNRRIEDEMGDEEGGYRGKVSKLLPSLVLLDNRRLTDRKSGKDVGTDQQVISPSDGRATFQAKQDSDGSELTSIGGATSEPGDASSSMQKKRKRGSRGAGHGAAFASSEPGATDNDEEGAREAEVASDEEDGAHGGTGDSKSKKPRKPAPEPYVPAPSSGKRGKRGRKEASSSNMNGTEDGGDAEWLDHTRATVLSGTEEANEDSLASGSKGRKAKADNGRGDTKRQKSKGKDRSANVRDPSSAKPKPKQEGKKDPKGPAKAWDQMDDGTTEQAKAKEQQHQAGEGDGGKKSSAGGVARIVEVKRQRASKPAGSVASSTLPKPTATFGAVGAGVGEGEGEVWGSGASAWD